MIKQRFWEIEEILDLYANGNTEKDIAKHFGTSEAVIKFIIRLESAKEYFKNKVHDM